MTTLINDKVDAYIQPSRTLPGGHHVIAQPVENGELTGELFTFVVYRDVSGFNGRQWMIDGDEDLQYATRKQAIELYTLHLARNARLIAQLEAMAK